MEPNQKIPPPITQPGDVGVHLSYIRRDIDQNKQDQIRGFEEIKKSIIDVTRKIDDLAVGFVTSTVFAKHLETTEDHETRIRSLEEAFSDVRTIKKIVYGAVTLILTIVLSAIVYFVIETK